MKKGLLGSTAIIAATALTAGVAGAAEAPTVKLGGFMDFQMYMPSNDDTLVGTATTQGRTMYFSVDDAEVKFTVSGTSDSGLNYGFVVEMEANNGATQIADESYLTLGGTFGRVELGANDGAEDSMAVGGESIQGATGGFDGDQGAWYNGPKSAPSGPGIDGDSGDANKITYYSNDMSGLKFGVSYAPQTGSEGSADAFNSGTHENYIGIGAQYGADMGGMAVKGGFVYGMAAADGNQPAATDDLSGFAVGATVGFGAFSVGLGYGDNGDADESFYDVAAGFSNGPVAASIGYFVGTDSSAATDATHTILSLTADYALAPGLSVYGEYTTIEDETAAAVTYEGSAITVGASVSF